MVVSSYKLFDKSHSLSVGTLVEEVEKSGFLNVPEKKALEPLSNAAKVTWEKIAILRSNLFAHRSKTLKQEDVFRKAHITPNQFKDFLDLTLEILNSFAEKLDQSPREFKCLSKRDTYKLLDQLQKKYKLL